MISLPKDLEALRTEEQSLAHRLARFRSIRLLLFSVLVVGLWLGHALDVDYRFTLPSLEGGVLKVELSDWMYLVPFVLFLFILSEAYRQILAKKCALLRLVAAHCLQTAPADEVTTLERLQLSIVAGSGSAFARHPGGYLRWLRRFWLLLLLYLLAHVVFAVPPWEHDNELFWLMLAASGRVGTLGIYAAAYIRHACGQLEDQVARTIECTFPLPWTARQWARGQRVAAWVLARLRPKLALSTGSLLILLTLVLPLALSPGRCGPDVEPGHKLITGEDGTMWTSSYLVLLSEDLSVFIPLEFTHASLNYLGRSLYSISVLAAAFTLLVVLAALAFPPALHNRELLIGLTRVTCAVALFVLADFAYPWWLFWREPLVFYVGFWLVPFVLWYRFAFSRQPAVRARWPHVRSRLVVLYLPLLLSHSVLMFVGVWQVEMWGLPVYLVGVVLLALGYLRLAHLEEARAHPRNAPGGSLGASEDRKQPDKELE